ncbi:MAG: DUF438 domain-containing protein [candidate division Zixibacteria bacterium HGW-Zixibacteria-1]|nr:MAG: DUF438 domain-containing protein [candidate division Zixibacteria bacterium HGW-Zixibacteria-1]
MSELIDNARKRKDLLKHTILQLHKGETPEAVKKQLSRLLGEVPYGDVVEVEQELIAEGLPEEEILQLCDLHSNVLKGAIDHEGAKVAPPGHPVHTFKEENKALGWEISTLQKLFDMAAKVNGADDTRVVAGEIRRHINALTDVEKHYSRKENLLFPYLEKHNITGPPKVMWGKHDEARELLKSAVEAVHNSEELSAEELRSVVELVLVPTVDAVDEMIYKEENILFPMCMDTLSDGEWYHISRQSIEIGFCLYDPKDDWKPDKIEGDAEKVVQGERIQLPSGSFTAIELEAILNSIPFDLTFVDKDDTVRYFTQGKERIFARNRAIIGRKVQLCHPPSSVHIVQKILDDFHSGRQNHASFWIEMRGRFISIEYFAMHSADGEYLGTLEVSQDLTEKRKLEGEQRLLNYAG